MRKPILSVLIVLLALVAMTIPAGAITNGQPDGNGHPYVGLVVLYDATGAPLWRCSGTQISPTVFLTAGHCTAPDGADVPAQAQVWFTPDRPAGYPFSGGTWGTPYPHPKYNNFADFPNIYDAGVVVLDEPVVLEQYGTLPPAGFLDTLDTARGTKDVTFTVVGYGVQEYKPHPISIIQRWVGEAHLVNLRSANTDGYNLMTSNNPGNWSGGTCSGDSGGPILYSDTNMVVGINSFGIAPWCKGNDYSYRTDIPDTRDFLGQFVPLP